MSGGGLDYAYLKVANMLDLLEQALATYQDSEEPEEEENDSDLESLRRTLLAESRTPSGVECIGILERLVSCWREQANTLRAVEWWLSGDSMAEDLVQDLHQALNVFKDT